MKNNEFVSIQETKINEIYGNEKKMNKRKNDAKLNEQQ